MTEKLILLLNKIGLNDAEAKVYLALLQFGSMSGYETSKVAQVPRSKVYNVLETLISKGYVIYNEQENNNLYAAVSIVQVANIINNETHGVLDELVGELKDCPFNVDLQSIWHIRQHFNVFSRCRTIIKNTKEELLVQIWEEDIQNVLEDIQVLEQKDIRMGIVYFSKNPESKIPLKKYCTHGFAEDKLKDMGGRWVTIVSDMREAIFGQILSNGMAEVLWTESKPLVVMAAECVKHDLYFYRTAAIDGKSLQKKLGTNYEKVRDIF